MKKKNLIKLIGIVALAVVIGFAFAACEADSNGGNGNGVTPCEHDAGVWHETAGPTCVAGGTSERRCTLCQHVLETDTNRPSATGHDAGDWHIAVQPTCIADGTSERRCTICQHVLETVDNYPPMSDEFHNVLSWEVTEQPTIQTEGEKEGTCTICEETVTRPVDKLEAFIWWGEMIPENSEYDLGNDTMGTPNRVGTTFNVNNLAGILNGDLTPALIPHPIVPEVIGVRVLQHGYIRHITQIPAVRERQTVVISQNRADGFIIIPRSFAPIVIEEDGSIVTQIFGVYEVEINGIEYYVFRAPRQDMQGTLTYVLNFN